MFSPIRNLLNPSAAWAAECLTRLVVRVFDQRPKELANVMYISDTIYNDLLRNLAYPVVWQILQQLIVKHPTELVVVVWFMFSCLVGSVIDEKERRGIRLVHWIGKKIDPDLIPFRDSVTRTIAYNLIGEFFLHADAKADDFRKCVLRHLPKLRELSQQHVRHCVFTLAKTVVMGLSEGKLTEALTRPLIRKAMDVIRNAESPNDPDTAGCLDFLVSCEIGLGIDDLLLILSKIMLSGELSSDFAVASEFAVRAAVALVEKRAPVSDVGKFRRGIEDIISKCWNSHGGKNGTLTAGCLAILASVRPGFRGQIAPFAQVDRKKSISAAEYKKGETERPAQSGFFQHLGST
jgi:hypothetical protein